MGVYIRLKSQQHIYGNSPRENKEMDCAKIHVMNYMVCGRGKEESKQEHGDTGGRN